MASTLTSHRTNLSASLFTFFARALRSALSYTFTSRLQVLQRSRGFAVGWCRIKVLFIRDLFSMILVCGVNSRISEPVLKPFSLTFNIYEDFNATLQPRQRLETFSIK